MTDKIAKKFSVGILSKFFLAVLSLILPSRFAFAARYGGNYNSGYISTGNYGSGLYCSGSSSYTSFCSMVGYFLNLVSLAIPIIISISVLVFVWGVFRYVIAEGGDKKEEGKKVMIYGIIGLFVMVSVWGIVTVVYNTFGFDNTNYFFFGY